MPYVARTQPAPTGASERDDAITLFDMPAIRDPSTLDVEVVQDWHRVDDRVPTRRKLVTINVGEMWPRQDYRDKNYPTYISCPYTRVEL